VPRKPRANDSDQSGTNFLDYPESMSLYERESLAAEVTLAERKKKSKPKKENKRTIRLRVVPLKIVPIAKSDKQ
jgi:hypothetical protein